MCRIVWTSFSVWDASTHQLLVQIEHVRGGRPIQISISMRVDRVTVTSSSLLTKR
jgi:hypothetical protein